MNPHRSAVRAAVDGLWQPARQALSLSVLQQIHRSGTETVTINILEEEVSDGGKVVTAGFDWTASLLQQVKERLAQSEVDPADVLEARLEVRFSFAPDVMRCTTAAEIPGSPDLRTRDFLVCNINGRSVLRTRYVHMWHDWHWRDQWPAGLETPHEHGAGDHRQSFN